MDALDKGEYACGIFIDLQKTFDTVDHEIIFEKLFHYGIRGKARHYLSPTPYRTQIICFDCWY